LVVLARAIRVGNVEFKVGGRPSAGVVKVRVEVAGFARRQRDRTRPPRVKRHVQTHFRFDAYGKGLPRLTACSLTCEGGTPRGEGARRRTDGADGFPYGHHRIVAGTADVLGGADLLAVV
jgi:hypothetical protein